VLPFKFGIKPLLILAIDMDTQTNEHDGDAGPKSYDAIVSRLAQEDKVPWFRKPNLRLLYLIMFPTCIGVEMTAG
jgi:hypothetical protein